MKKVILAVALCLIPTVAFSATWGFKGYSSALGGNSNTTCFVFSGKANVDNSFTAKDVTSYALLKTGTSTFTVDNSVDYKIECVQTASVRTAATAYFFTDGVGTAVFPISSLIARPK
jgi:hypothetical protein